MLAGHQGLGQGAPREDGNAQVDGASVGGASFDLGEFVFGTGEADLKSFDLTEPAPAFGFVDAAGEVVSDLDESVALSGVGPKC